jgi:putative PIN family toxin of toxin-antitoxin system
MIPSVRRRIILDTNVIIAGLRSRRGASFELLLRVDDGSFRLCLSIPLVIQYEAIIKRQSDQLGLSEQEIDTFVDFLCSVAEPVEIHYLWRPELSDPDDDMVLEAAVAGQCDCIVTHNTHDFQNAIHFGIQIVTPGDFLVLIGGS